MEEPVIIETLLKMEKFCANSTVLPCYFAASPSHN